MCVTRPRHKGKPRERANLILDQTGDILIKNKRNETTPLNDDDDEYDSIEIDINNWSNLEDAEVSHSAAVLYDRATNWIDCYPKATGSEEHILSKQCKSSQNPQTR